MTQIPGMTLDAARAALHPKFQRDIDADIKYDKCIWCKPGQAKKKKHALVDCPTAHPLPTDRTPLSDEVFNAGQQDAAVAYIHYAQLRHHPRANGATAFMAGLPPAQIGTYVVPVPAAPTALPTLPPVVNTYTPSSVVPPPPAALSGPLPSIIQLAPTAMPPPASITRTACATNIGAADETVSATLAADMQSLTITNANTALDARPSSEASEVGSQTDQDVGQIVVNRQSTTFGPTPTASVVPSVNLQDSAAINFTEAASSCPAPAASGHVASNPVSVNGDLGKRLSNLKGRAKYPLRHSLRTGPARGQVITNYFSMTLDPKTIFYEYHLIGIPASESRAGKKRYTETIIQNVPFLNTNRTLFATDNAATIISWINLHQYATGVRVATGDPVTGVGGAWRLLDIVDRNTTTRLTLQYSGQVDIAGLQSYANTTHPNTATYDPSPAETALNTIIATCITSNNTLHLNNHKFYVRDAFRDLRTSENNAIAPLRSLRGYSYRVHATMGNVLLNVSPANSAFWRPLLVSEVLQHGSGPFGGDVEDVKRALKNVRVYINYYRDSKDQKCKHKKCGDAKCTAGDRTGAPSLDVQHARLKTIRNFGLACSAQTFLWKCKDTQGNPIAGHRANVTVQDYQSRQYGRTLRHPGSPAVNIGTNLAPTWFAPEDLRIVPDQIYAKIIPDAVANDFHRDACRRPNEIRSRIEQEGLVHIPITPQPHNLLRCASISVNPTMLQIPSVHLQYPTVQYSGATTKRANHSGRWNLQNAKFLQPKTENVTWKLIVESGIEDNSVNILTQHFDLQLIQTGVTLTASRQGAPLILPLNATETDLQNTVATYLEDLAKQEELKQKQEPVPVPDIFVLLLCSKDQNLYSSFKYLADRVFAVQSICMTETNMTAPGGNITQYMANIAMKANLKMAGINHSSPGIETWMKNTLVLGADCTHPGSAALLGSPSVAAVVGSLEANGGRFRGKLKLQKGKQEIITDLGDFLLDHFRDWYTWHKQKFPENVLYYRDGVSTSQYDEVLRVELAGIEEAFQKLVTFFGGGNVKKPKITAVIVNKRHSTRFFPRQQGDAMPGNGNCKPGLLVESSITSPCYTDFYLQSHNGIKGTARSTHYTVIRNHMAMSTTQLEDLTHKLNHTYVRATLGVSYAAPAYYADRLCERARCYLRTWYNPNPNMRKNYQTLIRQQETTVETKRNNSHANRPPRLRGHKKTDVEIAEEKKDAAEVHEALEEWLKPRMRARFVGELHDVANNDAGRKRQMNMLRTMYWM